jgi:hypothetical protein
MLSALDNKSSVGRLFYSICPCFRHWTTGPLWVACSILSVHAFGTRPQVLYGSLVLLSVYAFGIRPQVLYGSLVLLSVYAFGTRPQVLYGSLVLLYVHAFGTRLQVLCGSLVLIHRFRLLVSLFSTSAVSRHTKLTSLITSGLDCLDSRLRFCLSLSRLLSYSCRLFLLITLVRESNCCWLPMPDLSV